LAINRSFGYLIHQLGLDKFDRDYVVTRIIESPFNFKTQALVGIPRDIPLASSEDFLKKTFMELARLIKVMKGRTFILFTSYRMLEKCHELLQGELEDSDIEILTQGDLPRSTLLKEFKRIEKAVLLGTDSFWEGVDVPGGDLECVVLMKLPFSVPTDPIIKARSDHLKKQGLNPFLKYHVPKAIIKFKQGFGRLIRNSNDRGIIIILDKRVIEKRYGKMFLNSLPPVKIIGGKFGKIVDYVGEWNEKRE
ncbi:MAG: ATP-dependent DNA helicase, partial [Vulcanimicrobiota bacterium]